MSTANGIYFDGRTARGMPVAIDADARALRLTGDGLGLEIPLGELRASDRLADIPRFVYLPDDAVVETADNAFVDAVLGAGRETRGARFIHALESQQRVAVAGCVLLVLAIGLLAYFGPPKLARVIAHRVPPEIDGRIGTAALATIAPYFGMSTLPAAERERVHRQLARLRAGAPGPAPRLEFRTMSGGQPNAFALPGNVIVVTDDLLRLPASDDEIAAVLAHELGHLEERHGLQSLLRNSFALLIVAAVTGDLSTLTSFAATLPLTILTAGYSRDLEREADRYALDLLRTRKIDSRKFTAVLVKLDLACAALPRNSTYLSTHPATEERIALFGALAPEAKAALIAEGDAQPVPVFQARPRYPFALRQRNIEGSVTVDFVINERGEVQGAKAIRSSNPGFDYYAEAAVAQWRFQPGRAKFRPVATHMQVPILFQLDSAAGEGRSPTQTHEAPPASR